MRYMMMTPLALDYSTGKGMPPPFRARHYPNGTSHSREIKLELVSIVAVYLHPPPSGSF